jgi:hypothetical protein
MTGENAARPSFLILCIGLVIACVLFGIRVEYTAATRYALAAAQLIVISIAAWNLGLRAVALQGDARQMLAAAAGLLIAPFALFALLAGIGPPGVQTDVENELRYLVLLFGAMATAGGTVVLRELLGDAGERFYSTLAFCAILFAGPMYVIFLCTQILVYHTMQGVADGHEPAGLVPLDELSGVFLFFGSLLTYVATAALGASLARVRWLGRRTAAFFVALSVFALVCLVARGPQFPDRAAALMHWYTTVGFVVGIPAVPWMIPCAFAVLLLRRAGNDQGLRI